MKATPISNPLPGEHLAAISPTLAPDAHEHWNRRLNLYPGRALSDAALTMEQNSRAGRLATYGQSLSAGIVRGLDVALEREPIPQRSRWYYNISGGLGLAASGEDVSLPRGVRVNVLDVEVAAPSFTFARSSESTALTRSYSTALLPRVIGPPLGKLLKEREAVERNDDETLPRVGILLLQPVTLEIVGDAKASDPCEEDPENYAFEDWQLVDGCRLLWYAWPTEWRPVPRGDGLRRNRLAYTIFEAEKNLAPDELLPWESLGVPLGLVAFNRRWKPLFFDRHAVVRAGGKPKRRASVLSGVGSPFLWQARIEQFAAQVADANLTNGEAESLASQFRFLPPAGLLPKSLLHPRKEGARDLFFPASYRVEAFPVPVEQLDAALEASAPLAPFDLSTADEVQVLVPVPQQWYEPDLLKVEAVNPVFIATIDRHARRRGKLLARRIQIRDRAAALDGAIGRPPVAWPNPDPRALELETPASNPIDVEDEFLRSPELSYGVDLAANEAVKMISNGLPVVIDNNRLEPEGSSFKLTPEHPSVEPLEALRTYLRRSSPVMRTYTQVLPTDAPGLELPGDLQVHPEWDLGDRVKYDDATRVLSFRGPMTVSDYEHLVQINGTPGYQAALGRLLLQTQDDDLAKLDAMGLTDFIAMLEKKVNAADDKVDLGFARVQTDIYRLRQHMLGTEAATRLATSPVLASIAKGDSAVATKDTLKSFVSDMKSQPSDDFPLATQFATPTIPARAPVATGGILLPQASESSSSTPAPMSLVSLRTARLTSDVFTAAPVGTTRTAAPTRLSFTSGFIGGEAMADAFAAPAGTTRPATPTELVRLAAATRVAALPVAPSFLGVKRDDVISQSPLVGKALDFRTVTLAERLEQPKSAEAKNYAVSTKADILTTLAELEINIDDLQLPGFYRYDPDGNLEATLFYDKPDTDPERRIVRIVPKERNHSFLEVKALSLTKEVVTGKHDIDPLNGDESAFFAAAVRTLDHVVAFLRLVEGRIQAYRAAIERCKQALGELLNLRAQIDSRLPVIESELTETRSDVAVARALLADENTRVRKINKRRNHIIEKHTQFYAYRRPRMLDLIEDAPSRRLDPAATEGLLPTSVSRRVHAPPELQQVVNLMKDVPLRWLRFLPPLLDRLDRVELMHEAMQEAKVRAAVQYETQQLKLKPTNPSGWLNIGKSLQQVLSAQRDLVTQKRVQTAHVDLSEFREQTWKRIRDQAADILSPGDLADGSHGRADVTHACTQELRNIAHVAACLYAEFGEVLPSLRLQWAEQLGQYDDVVNLRNLASLPRWGEIELLERREMQSMVDWLFGRLDPREPEAAKLMNDIVRIALLLASHAPVNEIVAGDVQQTASVTEGEQIELAADLEKVRVGMQVLMYAKQEKVTDPPLVIARAIVSDIGLGKIAAQIVHTVQPTVNLVTAMKAQFVPNDHPAVAAAPPKPAPRTLGEAIGGGLGKLGKALKGGGLL